MPKPLSICLEFSESASSRPGPTRFVRCVALAGGKPGLSVNAEGETLWMVPGGAFELWISGDERLILFRLEGAPGTTVHRGGRAVDVPVGKPVVLLDQDEIRWEGRRARVHVHGEAKEIHAPQALMQVMKAAGIIAAMTVGALTPSHAAGVQNPEPAPIEVRMQPPVPPPFNPNRKNQPPSVSPFIEPNRAWAKPEYQKDALVSLRVRIDAKAKPGDIRIVKDNAAKSLRTHFRKAAREAAGRMTYEPGIKDDVPCGGSLEFSILFPAGKQDTPSVVIQP